VRTAREGIESSERLGRRRWVIERTMGYAVAAVCEAAVRALGDGGRVEVELALRPALYR
jgi:hypothetical protein